MYNVNPRGYMNIVKSLKNGSFDRKLSDDSSFINPCVWREHFSKLLGPKITPTPSDLLMSEYIEQNCDKFESELGNEFTHKELLEAISNLANNKATSFDRITNEILKAAKLVIAGPTIKLFNKILDSSIYPSQWKCDILSPIHKSGSKDDPNNFRGVAVSSCFGKLFNKMLQKRLEKACQTKNVISDIQGSSKAGSRTSDHLLIVKFLIDKYVKQKGKHLYTCFVDLRRAFDTVPRTQTFYSLLHNYNIGGKFLKILQEMYKNNQIFVKLSDGLLQPFITTISVKQGCVFSPILFNLYIDKISQIFDQSCNPVRVKNTDLNCLLWADDLLLISKTPTGLQNCIDKMQNFYKDLGLEINLKKTKVIVFNRRGITLENKFNFYLNGTKLAITDQYQYLGIKLRPSGSFRSGVEELNDKASRAWFGISNTIYRNKRMEQEKVFRIFDSLITPIALYASCIWLPFNIKKSALNTPDSLLEAWGPLKAETLNQKCSKMILSVHSKASRLAVLGELGRYPIFISALSQCINYKFSILSRKTPTNLIGNVWSEMTEMSEKGIDCWLTRVTQIEKHFKIPSNLKYNKFSGKKITSILRGKFDCFWLRKINEIKNCGPDNQDHNKLRVYKTFKACFAAEPYITCVRNRNQRSALTRLRISAHSLATEVLRRTRPVTPFNERLCTFCRSSPSSLINQNTTTFDFVDTEQHFLLVCNKFRNTRNTFLAKISALRPGFDELSDTDKFSTLMCPTTPQETKLTNRFIKFMVEKREKMLIGDPDIF